MSESYLIKGLISLFLLSFMSIAYATPHSDINLKPTGISLEWYQHELDLNVTKLNTSVPNISDDALNSIKDQLNTQSDVEVISLRLDYQLRPYLNVFGAMGKITDTTQVNFSDFGVGVSDMVVDNEGTSYTVGAMLVGKYDKLLSSLQYAHSRIHLKDNAEDILVNTLASSVGMQTGLGVLSTSLVYQTTKATYSGTVTAPFVGEVPVTVNTESDDKFQLFAGLHTELIEDLYLSTNVNLSGKKQFHLQLNQRF